MECDRTGFQRGEREFSRRSHLPDWIGISKKKKIKSKLLNKVQTTRQGNNLLQPQRHNKKEQNDFDYILFFKCRERHSSRALNERHKDSWTGEDPWTITKGKYKLVVVESLTKLFQLNMIIKIAAAGKIPSHFPISLDPKAIGMSS